jgi:flagella basal body P-ring formation protein FlgA
MMRVPPDFCRLLLAVCLTATSYAALPDTTMPTVPATSTPTAARADYQDLAQLEDAAKSAAAAVLPRPSERQRLQVGPIQPGLRLQPCASGVQPAVAPGLRSPSRVLIEIRCEGPSRWQIYVPVRLIGTSPVVIAAHAIVMGSVLTAKDLLTEQRDVSALPIGYFDDPALTIGLTAARGIAGGAVLTNQQLVGARAVQRGQTVTLIADFGGMSVRMAGRALTDGLLNQRVKVENLSSGKIVEGIARSEQMVEVILN